MNGISFVSNHDAPSAIADTRPDLFICFIILGHDITPHILDQLDNEFLKELVPSVGARIRLRGKIKNYIVSLLFVYTFIPEKSKYTEATLTDVSIDFEWTKFCDLEIVIFDTNPL